MLSEVAFGDGFTSELVSCKNLEHEYLPINWMALSPQAHSNAMVIIQSSHSSGCLTILRATNLRMTAIPAKHIIAIVVLTSIGPLSAKMLESSLPMRPNILNNYCRSRSLKMSKQMRPNSELNSEQSLETDDDRSGCDLV